MPVEVELPGFPVIAQNRKAVNAAAFPLSMNLLEKLYFFSLWATIYFLCTSGTQFVKKMQIIVFE